MILGGIAPYFGSKREMAPQIVAHFGPHEMYYEPFAGSLSILMAKEPSRNEVVSEKNADVANLIRVLSYEPAAVYLWRQVELFGTSESLFLEAVENLSSDYPWDDLTPTQCDVGRAFDFLLVSWQGPSGLVGTSRKPRFAVRNTSSGGSVAARWRAVAPSIPDWHERLRNVEFRCRDAFELVDAMPDRDGVLCYADPPYLPETRTAGRYTCDFTDADHDRLATALRRFTKTKVVVSLYGSERADALYAGWRKVPLVAPRKMKHTAGGEQVTESAGEVLYINRD